MIVKEVKARRIKDSRGEETIEVSVNGAPCASSPSGKSTGAHESRPYYKDLGSCVRYLNDWHHLPIVARLEDLNVIEKLIMKDLKLKEAQQFGGNALYAFESAIMKALAHEQKKELWQMINARAKRMPIPVGNAVGGGLHSEKLARRPVFQEFLIIPHESTFAENVKVMKELYKELGKHLRAKDVNDEGAWLTEKDDEAVLELFSAMRGKADFGVDVAASSFYKRGTYNYRTLSRTRIAQIEHILFLAKLYVPLYLEDPCNEEDFSGFHELKKELHETIIVGDDLTATHPDRLEKAIKERSIGAVIVKPNQNGSLLALKEVFDICKKHKIVTVMSHRSGETMDDALADYAFAFGADYIKCGIATPWRDAKLQRMIAIERSLS